MLNTTCNSTLEDMRISPGSERILVGSLNFHDLARIISAGCTLIACLMSFFLIWMHALNYTQPREQRYIIRILFMVPVYAVSSYLQLEYYWHAIYFQVISDCYEAFAIASFFALLCHYVSPDLHSQKIFFREMRPIKQWVLPINWFAKCCGGQRGPWRIPKSGLTWFNIIWIGVYHYCFIRVTMTISAVVSQYFGRYCESSNSPVFGHIWIIVLNATAVTIAMYCLVQFYVQLKEALAEHKLFTKILAIKLVVFLSFWQASSISVGTSTLQIVHPNEVVAYPDLKVGIPSLLLCVEMALFAFLHIWAFPYSPYIPGAPRTYYPPPDADKMSPSVENERQPPSGGFLGVMAIWDALNIWDFVKAFGRGMRWLFVGVKRRKEDASYKLDDHGETVALHNVSKKTKQDPSSYDALRPSPAMAKTDTGYDQYRPTMEGFNASSQHLPTLGFVTDERAGLMNHAQPDPSLHGYTSTPPPRPPRAASPYGEPFQVSSSPQFQNQIGVAHGGYDYDVHPGSRRDAPNEAQSRLGQALWGPQTTTRPTR